MKKWVKWLGGAASVAIMIPVGAIAWATMSWPPHYPDAPKPDLRASKDPLVIERGKYLFHTAGHCAGCHAKVNDVKSAKTAFDIVPTGGHEWHFGPLAVLRSTNLTTDPETGIAQLSDPDLARIILHATRPDDTIAPMMHTVGGISEGDVVAIISYMRTLKPVKSEKYQDDFTTFGKLILRTAMGGITKPKFRQAPPEVKTAGISVEKGRYLADGPANCLACHSTSKPGSFDTDVYYAGGSDPFPDEVEEGMEFAAPNLSSHPERGFIANWTEDQFAARFKAGRTYQGSPMPWENYKGMTDDDIRSIYRYLKTVAPQERDPGPVHRKAGWKPEKT